MTQNSKLYRPCVGLLILNANGEVFAGERLDKLGAWQMPQGGIDEGEDLEIAAFREMKEEIGTDKAEIIRIHDTPIRYDLPAEIQAKLWGGKYAGQEQTWIALRFTGQDSDINLEAYEHPEFAQWKWMEFSELLNLIVPFKRDTYEQIQSAFSDLLA